MPMIRSEFSDSQLATQLPALNKITFTQFNKYPDQYSRVFNVKNSTRAIEQFSGMSGFGLFAQINAEGGQITFDSAKQTYDKTFTHGTFARGYSVSHELSADDKFGLIGNFAKELGRSARLTIEYDAVSDFNNAFDTNYLGPDGVTLCSTAHPRVKAGGTQRNRPTADVDFDIPNLQAALVDFADWTDDAGKLWMVEPVQVVCPSELEFTVAEVLASAMRSDTAENTTNAFRHRDGLSPFRDYFVWRYLTDPDAWFVTAEPSDLSLCFFWREKFNTTSEMDFYTRSMLTGGWMRYSHGWFDWPGIWGTQGG